MEELLKLPRSKKRLKIVVAIVSGVIIIAALIGGLGYYAFHYQVENVYLRKALNIIPLPVAVVNYRPILIKDYLNDLDSAITLHEKFYQIDFKSEAGQTKLKALESQVIDQLIDNKVTEQLAKKYNIQVSEDEVGKEFDKVVTENQNLESVQKILENNYGWTIPQFKTKIKEELLSQKLSEGVLRQVRARHILIKVPSDSPQSVWDQAYKKALAIKERLAKGEPFEDLAKEASDDETNKNLGGELGWFSSGRMAPEFEKAAFSLKVGEISDPVKTDLGWHLIQVEDKKGFVETSFLDWFNEQKSKMKVWRFIK